MSPDKLNILDLQVACHAGMEHCNVGITTFDVVGTISHSRPARHNLTVFCGFFSPSNYLSKFNHHKGVWRDATI